MREGTSVPRTHVNSHQGTDNNNERFQSMLEGIEKIYMGVRVEGWI